MKEGNFSDPLRFIFEEHVGKKAPSPLGQPWWHCNANYDYILLMLKVYEDHFDLDELDAGALLRALNKNSISWKAFGSKEALCSR